MARAPYKKRPPAGALAQLAGDLRDEREGAWTEFLALDLRGARLVVAALVDMGLLLGRGTALDKANAECMRRTRAGEEDHADYLGDGYVPSDTMKAAQGVRSAAIHNGVKARAARRRAAKLSMRVAKP